MTSRATATTLHEPMPSFLRDGGEAGALMRALDWEGTPLGPPEGWPTPLKTLVQLMLASRQAMFLCWGPARTTLYNDAYAEILAGRHPTAMGRPFEEVWPEIWDADLEPIVARAYAGESVHMDDIPLVMTRKGYPEEAHFSFSYTPIRGEDGAVLGFFCPCDEITEPVLEARRARVQAELAERLRDLGAPDQIKGAACELIGRRLGVAVVGYGEVGADEDAVLVEREHDDGRMPGAIGWQRLSECGPGLRDALRAGEALFAEDAEADPRQAAGRAQAMRARSAAVVPLIKNGRLVAVLRALHPEPRAWREAERALLRETVERIWTAVGRARAEAARVESERRLRALVEDIPELVWRSDDGGEWTWASPQWAAYTGQPPHESLGRGWLDALHPEDRAVALAAWAAAEGGRRFEVEYRVREAATGRHRWFQTRATPVRCDGRGPVLEWIGVTTDVHELRELHERQHVMVAELQHRTRNLIAVVMSIAQQTLRRSASLEAFGERFEERLEALSRVQGLLSRAEERAVPIETLLRLELDALGVEGASDRVRLDGPEARLCGASVQTMALVIHELATNARKHGALAGEHGRLDVTWRLREAEGDEPPRLALEWVESGAGPLTGGAPPGRRGYGRHLIERALPYALGATTAFELRPHGVRCAIELPLVRP